MADKDLIEEENKPLALFGPEPDLPPAVTVPFGGLKVVAGELFEEEANEKDSEIRIIVVVEGGIAHSIFCNHKNAAASILDWDNVASVLDYESEEEIEEAKSKAERLKKEIETLHDIPFDGI